MTEIEFKWLTEPLAVLLTGKGVFIVSIVIAVIFGFIYILTIDNSIIMEKHLICITILKRLPPNIDSRPNL